MTRTPTPTQEATSVEAAKTFGPDGSTLAQLISTGGMCAEGKGHQPGLVTVNAATFQELTAYTATLQARAEAAEAKIKGYQYHLRECEQIAGRALGYPWFKDDQSNFSGATEADGVCVGEHIGDTIVEELATKYRAAEAENLALREALFVAAPHHQGGHSRSGSMIAKALGVPFPVSCPDLVSKARAAGLNPAQLWPWLVEMNPDLFTPSETATLTQPVEEA